MKDKENVRFVTKEKEKGKDRRSSLLAIISYSYSHSTFANRPSPITGEDATQD